MAAKLSDKTALPPGALVYVGENQPKKTRISIFEYDQSTLEHPSLDSGGRTPGMKSPGKVSWFEINGVSQTGTINELGEIFGLHALVTEDIVNTKHRPKLEEYDGYLFLILRDLSYSPETKELASDQVSLVLGREFVLSFHHSQKSLFAPIQNRLEHSKGRIRARGADYLAYALIDTIVDRYFSALEAIADELELVEADILGQPSPDELRRLQKLRSDLLLFRKSVWPLREVINLLLANDTDLIEDATIKYLRDVQDHLVQILDTIDTQRELLNGLHDLYLSMISNRMNQIMKVLTIIATLFIPLTFLAGVYGMNFKYMPELNQPWAYPAVWGVMLVTAALMLLWFRKNRWL